MRWLTALGSLGLGGWGLAAHLDPRVTEPSGWLAAHPVSFVGLLVFGLWAVVYAGLSGPEPKPKPKPEPRLLLVALPGED
ncbi:MAG: hypothetical protein KC613_22555 [Myxococcales bacterium]|nr:hypothetical protein [Myxococcales bacterium]